MEFFATGGFQQLFSDLEQPLMTPDELDLNYNLYGINQTQPEGNEQEQEPDFLNKSCVSLPAHGNSQSNQNYVTPDYCCYEDVTFCTSTSTLASTSTSIENTALSTEPTQVQEKASSCDYYGTITLDQMPNHSSQTQGISIDLDLNNPNSNNTNSNGDTSTYHYMSPLILAPDTADTDRYSSSYGGVFNATDDQDQFTDWENRFLDNFIEIPELVELLPEKTPLCTDMCDYFLQESSNNLKLSELPLTDEAFLLSPISAGSESIVSSVSISSSAVSITLKLPDLPGDGEGKEAKMTTTLTDKGYPCSYGNCQKIYAKPAHLKAHLRRHLGEKPYICKWPGCSWKFSRSDELARHGRSHSGVKPYKCDYCGKCFARSDHLTKHRKVHERRLLAASRAGKLMDNVLTQSIYTVRPGRKRKNQLC